MTLRIVPRLGKSAKTSIPSSGEQLDFERSFGDGRKVTDAHTRKLLRLMAIMLTECVPDSASMKGELEQISGQLQSLASGSSGEISSEGIDGKSNERQSYPVERSTIRVCWG